MKSMRLGLWLLLLTTSLSALAPQPQIKDVFAIRNQLRESYRALYTQPFSQAGVEHFNQTNEQLARQLSSISSYNTAQAYSLLASIPLELWPSLMTQATFHHPWPDFLQILWSHPQFHANLQDYFGEEASLDQRIENPFESFLSFSFSAEDHLDGPVHASIQQQFLPNQQLTSYAPWTYQILIRFFEESVLHNNPRMANAWFQTVVSWTRMFRNNWQSYPQAIRTSVIDVLLNELFDKPLLKKNILQWLNILLTEHSWSDAMTPDQQRDLNDYLLSIVSHGNINEVEILVRHNYQYLFSDPAQVELRKALGTRFMGLLTREDNQLEAIRSRYFDNDQPWMDEQLINILISLDPIFLEQTVSSLKQQHVYSPKKFSVHGGTRHVARELLEADFGETRRIIAQAIPLVQLLTAYLHDQQTPSLHNISALFDEIYTLWNHERQWVIFMDRRRYPDLDMSQFNALSEAIHQLIVDMDNQTFLKNFNFIFDWYPEYLNSLPASPEGLDDLIFSKTAACLGVQPRETGPFQHLDNVETLLMGLIIPVQDRAFYPVEIKALLRDLTEVDIKVLKNILMGLNSFSQTKLKYPQEAMQHVFPVLVSNIFSVQNVHIGTLVQALFSIRHRNMKPYIKKYIGIAGDFVPFINSTAHVIAEDPDTRQTFHNNVAAWLNFFESDQARSLQTTIKHNEQKLDQLLAKPLQTTTAWFNEYRDSLDSSS